MVGWHLQLNRHMFKQTLGDSEGQGILVCCVSWGCKELDTTQQLNNKNKLLIQNLCFSLTIFLITNCQLCVFSRLLYQMQKFLIDYKTAPQEITPSLSYLFLIDNNYYVMGFRGSSACKESAYNAGDPGLIPRLGRSPGEGISYPLQYSWASLVAQLVKNPPALRETWV